MTASCQEGQFARKLYYDSIFGIQAAKLLPGEYYATRRNMMIVTVLGSCVSACIRDPVAKIGGMNHFMLPDRGGGEKSPMGMSARYGAYAMEVLINNLLQKGADRSRLEAKVFGAGHVMSCMTDVGRRNAGFVLDYLKHEQIKVLAHDLGEAYPLKVYYFPHTGIVKVRVLRHMHNDTIALREKSYRAMVESSPDAGNVELF